jgi:hypothetical protein
MYQMEFYRKILQWSPAGSHVLSGACGEWFEGDDPEVRVLPTLDGPQDVLTVFRYGGVSADSSFSRFRSEHEGAQLLLEREPRIRTEMLPRVFTVVRLRLTLLSYLVRVPAAVGFLPQAPFLDIDVAMRMLTLPDELREERRWVYQYFADRDADLESLRLPSDNRNTLNYRAMRRRPLRPLDARVLSEVVRPEYVRRVNAGIGPAGVAWEALWRLGWTPGFRRAVNVTRRWGLTQRRLAAYGAYLTLLPIEKLLRRRDAAAGDGA